MRNFDSTCLQNDFKKSISIVAYLLKELWKDVREIMHTIIIWKLHSAFQLSNTSIQKHGIYGMHKYYLKHIFCPVRCRYLTPSSTVWWNDAEPMIPKRVTWSDRQSCIYRVNHTTHLTGQRRKQQLILVGGWTEGMLLCAFVIKRSFCFSKLTINTLQLVVEVVISCIHSEYMICLYKSRAVHNISLYFSVFKQEPTL